MMEATPQFWTQMAESFQQNLAKGFTQAMQHFQTIDLGGMGKDAGTASVPALQFKPEKLQALQAQYFSEATELWNQAMHNSLQIKDRRFSSEAWSSSSTPSRLRRLILVARKTSSRRVFITSPRWGSLP